MKRITKQLIALAAMGSMTASAINITIEDPHANELGGSGPANNPSGQANEVNEVEIGATTAQGWDLRSFDLTPADLLSVNGRFNYDTGNGVYEIGDIFIYVNPAAGQPYTLATPTTHTITGASGRDDWAYVIQFERDSSTVVFNADGPDLKVVGGKVEYKIVPKSANPTVYYTAQDASGVNHGLPLYVAPSTDLGTGLFADFSVNSGDFSLSNIDLSMLSAPGDVYYHITQSCGNDVLWGHSVPDGGLTVALMGLGLFGIVGASRRR